MEKKKTKLTISGNLKKPIDSIDLARSQNKKSVIIEKKPSRFANNTFKKNSPFKTNVKRNLSFNENTPISRTPKIFKKSQQFGVSRLWLSFSITSGKINL